MATTPINLITDPNLFPGEYASGVMGSMVVGGDSVASGLFRVLPAISGTVIVKGMNRTSALQTGNLCTSNLTNTTSMYDKEFSVQDYKVQERYCKDDLAATNYAVTAPAGAWNAEYPAEVLQAMVDQIAGEEQDNIEKILWSGDTTSLDPLLALQDGLIKIIKAYGVYDATLNPDGYIRVTAVALTSANIIAQIQRVIDATPIQVKNKANFKIIVSPEIHSLYVAALTTNLAVWNPFLQARPDGASVSFIGNFAGTTYPMYVAPGLITVNDDVMLAGNFSNDRMGNLLFATDALTDKSTVIVQDRQAVFASEPFYDVSMFFRVGWEVMKAFEVVLYHS